MLYKGCSTHLSLGFATKDNLCYAQRPLWISDNAVWISEFRSQFSKTYGSYFERLEYRFALTYIYDIIIFSRFVDEHLVHLEEVFRRLSDANVKLNPKKCSFVKQRLEYLGHVVTPEGISPNPDKVRVIQEFPTPTKLKELRSFLGFANYYRRFVRGFSKYCQPFECFEKEERSFWLDCSLCRGFWQA